VIEFCLLTYLYFLKEEDRDRDGVVGVDRWRRHHGAANRWGRPEVTQGRMERNRRGDIGCGGGSEARWSAADGKGVTLR